MLALAEAAGPYCATPRPSPTGVSVTFPDGSTAEAAPRPDLGIKGLWAAVAGKQVRFYAVKGGGDGAIVVIDVTRQAMATVQARIQAFRELDALLRYQKDQAVKRAKESEPIDFRAQHPPLAGVPAIEPVHEQIPDERGAIGVPMGRATDTLAALRRNRTIDPQQLSVGRHFEAVFRQAGLDGMKAADWRRIPIQGNTSPAVTAAMVEARNELHSYIEELGGLTSIRALVCWHVLGLGETMKEFASQSPARHKRRLRPAVVTGLLIASLDTLKRVVVTGR